MEINRFFALFPKPLIQLLLGSRFADIVRDDLALGGTAALGAAAHSATLKERPRKPNGSAIFPTAARAEMPYSAPRPSLKLPLNSAMFCSRRKLDQAIENEKRAVDAWASTVEAAGDLYREDLVCGPHAKSYPYHWKEELLNLQRDFSRLLAEREEAASRADGEKRLFAGSREISFDPPVAKLLPVVVAERGQNLRLSARVSAPAGVRWVRLRYRHPPPDAVRRLSGRPYCQVYL